MGTDFTSHSSFWEDSSSQTRYSMTLKHFSTFILFFHCAAVAQSRTLPKTHRCDPKLHQIQKLHREVSISWLISKILRMNCFGTDLLPDKLITDQLWNSTVTEEMKFLDKAITVIFYWLMNAEKGKNFVDHCFKMTHSKQKHFFIILALKVWAYRDHILIS